MRSVCNWEVTALRIWSLADPYDSRYACFTAYAPSWRQDGQCPDCKRSIPAAVRKRPLHLSWDEGSDLVADFTWGPGSGAILVTDMVLQALAGHFSGFEGAPVEMIQEPKLKRPIRPNRRSKRRVWLPYEGPPSRNYGSQLESRAICSDLHCSCPYTVPRAGSGSTRSLAVRKSIPNGIAPSCVRNTLVFLASPAKVYSFVRRISRVPTCSRSSSGMITPCAPIAQRTSSRSKVSLTLSSSKSVSLSDERAAAGTVLRPRRRTRIEGGADLVGQISQIMPTRASAPLVGLLRYLIHPARSLAK